MDDRALLAAQQRLAEIEQAVSQRRNTLADLNAEIARLQAESGDLKAWIGTWHRLTGTPQHPVAAERSEIGLPVKAVEKRTRPRNPDRDEVVEQS